MAHKKVFVSFDFDNDRHYKYLLEAWHAHPDFDFVFSDQTPREIDSDNVGRVKAAISTKIKGATYTLVIVGEYANMRHKDYKLIGYKNWQNWEIAQSKTYGNKLVAIKIKSSYESPDELLKAGAKWAMSFTEDAIVKALNAA